MIAWALALARTFLFAGLKWLAIGAAVAAVLFGARRAGRHAERVERLQRELEGAKERVRLEADIRAADDGVLDERLRHPSRRRRL
ncbi:MAG: hypothetical protein ACT4P2_12555 [Pseudomonadota bacterium]